MDLCNMEEIQPLLHRHGFHFSKSMGQNFLIDASVPAHIAAASGAGTGCGVLEIGPGIGCLTRQLAALADKVVSVELDKALLPILEETLADCPNTEVIPGDIMKLDLPALTDAHFSGLQVMVCANLPYNITTPLLTHLIDSHCFSAITVMIQREVALRICAAPGTRDYGAYSLYCQYYTQPELLFEVPPTCFLPAPKVTSAVIRLVPRKSPPVQVDSEDLLFRIVRAAFGMRRKTLLNGLSAAFGDKLDKAVLRTALADCGLPETVRGEKLSLEEYAALANWLLPRL